MIANQVIRKAVDPALGRPDEIPGRTVPFRPFPFHTVHVGDQPGASMAKHPERRYGTGIAAFENDIMLLPEGVPEAEVVVNEVCSRTHQLFRTGFPDDLNSLIITIFVWMERRIVHGHLMALGDQPGCQGFGQLFESPVSVRYTLGACNGDLHIGVASCSGSERVLP